MTATPAPFSVGTDLVWVPRFRKICAADQGFLDGVFTEREVAPCRTRRGGWRFESLAARFAAKEAVLKALRIGLYDAEGGDLREIEVLTAPEGYPYLELTGPYAVAAARRALTAWAVSLSHTGEYAVAYVVGHGVPARPAGVPAGAPDAAR
jgi:holo-[acyl-carrier protein] synthase